MNIFIIPSWYPNETEPIAGIFTREQAEATAQFCPDTNVIVSLWGQHDGYIQIRRPWLILKVLMWRLRERGNRLSINNGVYEAFNPAISWTRRILNGTNNLISANRRNLKLSIKKFGHVDLIHAHVCYPAGYIASVLAKEFNIPYIITEHMSPFPFPSLLSGKRLIRPVSEALDQASTIIAVSPSLGDRIASFGYPNPLIIPNLVDERKFNIDFPSTKKFIFFTLCGLIPQKGVDHLLRAIAVWKPNSDKFEFRIGGIGPMRASYEALAIRLGIADRIKWLGAVSREDAPRLFRECHVYVMPSIHETFGVVYAEAIACGKPVIATRCGGPEYIVNDQNGLLVDIGDLNALSKAMIFMAENWLNYDPLKVRATFISRFSRQAVVQQLKEVYIRTLEQ